MGDGSVMARCAWSRCGRRRLDALARRMGTGVELARAGSCSQPCLQLAVQDRLGRVARSRKASAPGLPPSKLGVMLLARTGLTRELLDRALERQRFSGKRIGEELIEMGAVNAQDVLRALAAQSNSRYLTTVDVSIVRRGYAGLSRDMVRALGVVPFAADATTHLLKVATIAPIPRLALAAVRELTGWAPQPYLVTDEVWPSLVAAYGSSAMDEGIRRTAATETVGAATDRIALAAEEGGEARLSHARIDPYLWVRIETPGRTEDMLMTADTFDEDHSCQMERISR
jgi:hypothetical protein